VRSGATTTLYTYNEQAEEVRLRKKERRKEKNDIRASDSIVQGTISQ
jgi:hypothetical protein